MRLWRLRRLQQPVLWLLLCTLLLPVLSGCASPPARPQVLGLAGIVVDGERLARPDETGLVQVWRGGQRLDGVAGLVLQPGDRVETGPSATAVLRWPSGSEVHLWPGSSGVVGSFTDLVGAAFASIRGVFAVETQYVRAGAQGTQYLVRSTPGGGASVTVFEGRVEVASRLNAWPAVVLGPGAGVLAHPQAPQPQAVPAQELQRTRDWVRQVEQLVPPPGAGSAGSGTAAAVGIGALLLGAALLASGRDKPSDPRPAAPAPHAPPGGTQAPNSDLSFRPGTAAVTPPGSLAAPAGTRPGTPGERSAPQLVCRDPLTLQWDRVAGARDYLVQLETRSRSGNWMAVGMSPSTTADLQARTPPALSGLHRWRVQARHGATLGPFSGWLHLQCAPYRPG